MAREPSVWFECAARCPAISRAGGGIQCQLPSGHDPHAVMHVHGPNSWNYDAGFEILQSGGRASKPLKLTDKGGGTYAIDLSSEETSAIGAVQISVTDDP